MYMWRKKDVFCSVALLPKKIKRTKAKKEKKKNNNPDIISSSGLCC